MVLTWTTEVGRVSRVNINGQGLEKMCLGVVYSKMAAGLILNLRVNEGSYSQNGFITVRAILDFSIM